MNILKFPPRMLYGKTIAEQEWFKDAQKKKTDELKERLDLPRSSNATQ